MPAYGARYLMPLWPMIALLAAAFLKRLLPRYGRLLATLLLLWLIAGAALGNNAGYRFELGYFFPSEVHRIARTLRERSPATDLLLVDQEVLRLDPEGLYSRPPGLPVKTIIRADEDPLATVKPLHNRFPYLALLYRTRDRASFGPLMQQLDRSLCERVLDAHGFTLDRYALAGAWCPNRPVRLVYDAGITLSEPDIALVNGSLGVELLLRSADARVPRHYSIALQLVDVMSPERIARLDLGVGPGNIVPLRAEFDVRELPAGEYALRLTLYNWESGARVRARDLALGHISDIHTLNHVQLS